MRWHRLGLLLALTGCSASQTCPQIGCVSELVVALPAGVSAAQACVAGVCTSTVEDDGALHVPLGRREEGGTAQVTVTLPGAQSFEGEVALERTRPNGVGCPPVCVNGAAVLDVDAGTVVGAPA